MKKVKEAILWLMFGALMCLLICGIYFCSFYTADSVSKCPKSKDNLCSFFEIFSEKESIGPIGHVIDNTAIVRFNKIKAA